MAVSSQLPYERRNGEYLISTDLARLDLDVIYAALSRSYWAAQRSRELVARSLQGSLCFGLYHSAEQVGLARVVTDFATFAWLCDVFVLEEHRGRGLGVWLIETVVSHPELREMGRIMLATRDAHDLYRRFSFAPIVAPERWMERRSGASPQPQQPAGT